MKTTYYSALTLLCALVLFTCDNVSPSQTKSPENTLSTGDTISPAAVLDTLNARILESPNDPEVYKARAEYHWAQQDMVAALNDLDLGLKADSTRADLHFAKGEIYYASTQFDLAMESYQDCLDQEPNNIDCLLRLAEMNVHLKQYANAIQNLNNALKQDDQIPLAYYIKGRVYKETGDTNLAASSYQTAIEVDPEYYDAYIEVGLLYAAAGSDLAMEYYNTALELRPNSVEAKYNLAYYLQSTGFRDTTRYRESLKLYDDILTLDPSNAAAAFNQGFIDLEYLQDYNAAKERFSYAIDLYPQYFQAFYNRGLCWESLGKNEEALKDYNRALSLKPNFTAAAKAKGRVSGDD